LRVHQYDLTAANVIASRILVATRDSFYQPGIPALTANLSIPQLAPDGKIYITTGNSTTYFGRINSPDNLGTACDVAQHSVIIPTYNFNTLPNHPNYFLGKIPGSPCDTIVGVGMDDLQDITVRVYPNPSNGNFTLSFPVQGEAGNVEIYDVNGKLVHQEYVAAWSQFKKLELTGMRKGIYFCKMKWEGKERAVKIIIE
ncbi:MAG: T9SS type A sorting domain-containing protein, partial [Bacteroidota bacterium]|nr:T9SS type A sorting domain-containing protein [Bacteroidota bacterium]